MVFGFYQTPQHHPVWQTWNAPRCQTGAKGLMGCGFHRIWVSTEWENGGFIIFNNISWCSERDMKFQNFLRIQAGGRKGLWFSLTLIRWRMKVVIFGKINQCLKRKIKGWKFSQHLIREWRMIKKVIMGNDFCAEFYWISAEKW